MSWSELERLVAEAENDRDLRRALRHCRSKQELVVAARRLGYRITRVDIQRARKEDPNQEAENRVIRTSALEG
jgi:predicted ribosomally synthesized peptide with nif11-like leader